MATVAEAKQDVQLAAIAFTADELDDKVVQQFGGKRPVDELRG